MKTKTSENLAWCAGFIDGEGSFTLVRRKNGNHAFRVAAAQSHEAVLIRLQSILGGRVFGPYGPYGNSLQKTPNWLWAIQTTNETRETLRDLWPYLGIVKREQAMAALSEIGIDWNYDE